MSSQRNSSFLPSGPPPGQDRWVYHPNTPGAGSRPGRPLSFTRQLEGDALSCASDPGDAIRHHHRHPSESGTSPTTTTPSPPQVRTGLSEATGDRGDRRQLATVGTQDRLSILPCAACAAPRDGGESASVPRGSGATAFGWMLSSGCGPCCGLSSRMGWWCLASNRVGGEVGLGVWHR